MMTGTFVATMQRIALLQQKYMDEQDPCSLTFWYKCHWPKSDLWTVLQLPLTKINAQTGLKNGPNIIEPIRPNNLWTRKMTAEESCVDIRAANLKRNSSCALRTHCSVMTEVKIDKSFYYVVTSFCRLRLHTIFDRVFLFLFRIYTAEVSLFLLSFSAIIQGLVCVQLKSQFLSKRNYTEIKKASFSKKLYGHITKHPFL